MEWRNKSREVVSRRWLLTGVEGETPSLTRWQIGQNPAPVDANGVPFPNGAQSDGIAYMIGVLGDMVNGDHAYDYRKLDINSDLGFFAQAEGVVGATDTDLMAAARNGAKFIFYHGWADPQLNPLNTIDYRDALVARYGRKTVDSFMRLFMVPGMTHCTGGSQATDQFDQMIPPMEEWLDTGIAPKQVTASKIVNGVVTRTRPLCAYPRYARATLPADAASDINDAANFYCAMPRDRRNGEAERHIRGEDQQDATDAEVGED